MTSKYGYTIQPPIFKLTLEKVNILCTGKIDVSGKSLLNPEGDVSNLVIFIDKEKPKKGEQVKVDGNSEMRAIVYAPYSEVKIGGKSRVKGNYFALSGHINGEAELEMPGRESYQPPMASACAGISRAGTNEEFKLGEVYSFPNPAKQCNPTIHFECGIAEKVEIRIYNIAAELVKAAEITKQPEIINGKYAYEYTWDVNGVASGVYLYLVKAYKNGEVLKALKKLAVIK